VKTEEVEIVAMLLLLYCRKTLRMSVLVILLVKNKKKLECKYDNIGAFPYVLGSLDSIFLDLF